MRKVNGKVADDSKRIKDHQVQTILGSVTAPDLFFYPRRVAGDDIFSVLKTCEVLLDYPKIGG